MRYERKAESRQAKAEKRRRAEARAMKRQALSPPSGWREGWAAMGYAGPEAWGARG